MTLIHLLYMSWLEISGLKRFKNISCLYNISCLTVLVTILVAFASVSHALSIEIVPIYAP